MPPITPEKKALAQPHGGDLYLADEVLINSGLLEGTAGVILQFWIGDTVYATVKLNDELIWAYVPIGHLEIIQRASPETSKQMAECAPEHRCAPWL